MLAVAAIEEPWFCSGGDDFVGIPTCLTNEANHEEARFALMDDSWPGILCDEDSGCQLVRERDPGITCSFPAFRLGDQTNSCQISKGLTGDQQQAAFV